MVKTDEFMANRILWKAANQGLPTHLSFFFKHIAPDLQEYLSQYADSAPVLFFTKPTGEWTLVCTRQVIGNDKTNIVKINLKDIVQIRAADFDFTRGSVDITKVKKKTEWDRLRVEANSSLHILHAGPGTDLFALWNVLEMAVHIL